MLSVTSFISGRYLFPTFENDLFLCGLDEDLSDEEKS